jgi:hypothetical protein
MAISYSLNTCEELDDVDATDGRPSGYRFVKLGLRLGGTLDTGLFIAE